MLEAALQGVAFAAVPLIAYKGYACLRGQQGGGVVGAAVVHHDDVMAVSFRFVYDTDNRSAIVVCRNNHADASVAECLSHVVHRGQQLLQVNTILE